MMMKNWTKDVNLLISDMINKNKIHNGQYCLWYTSRFPLMIDQLSVNSYWYWDNMNVILSMWTCWMIGKWHHSCRHQRVKSWTFFAVFCLGFPTIFRVIWRSSGKVSSALLDYYYSIMQLQWQDILFQSLCLYRAYTAHHHHHHHVRL